MIRAGGYYHNAIFYNINTLMYRPCPNCLSFLLQTFPSPADSTFRDRQLFFDSQLKACFDEVDRTRLQLALQQFAKENNSSPGDSYIAHCSVHQQKKL